MERQVHVGEVKAFKTRSGNRRFVLRDGDGNEYTTFRERIARQALAAEGGRARIECHEERRDGFTNVYLDKVEPLEDDAPGASAHDEDGREPEEVASRTTVDVVPRGESPTRVPPEGFLEKLKPFKELVAADVRDGENPESG